MGTRHLIAVQLDGQYRIAQYGQWDGYPSGAGETVVEFLKCWDRPLFESKLRASSLLTKEDLDKLNETIQKEGIRDWPTRWPELSRDTGAAILEKVQNSEPGIKLKNSIDFAGESLFCEYAYVIDLDTNKLEVFKGYNKEPVKEGERFFAAKRDPDSPEYHPVRLVGSYDLNDLPTVAMMDKACGREEE